MASQFLRFLENIENGRKNAIKNAKTAGLPASDDMSLLALSDLYLYQNNNENLSIESDKPEEQYYQLWEEPKGWPDLKKILSEAEDIVVGSTVYKPWVAVTVDARIEITKPLVTHKAHLYRYKTSDGQILDGSTSSITWDTSKDIHCSDGMTVRYIIVYKSESDIAYSDSMYYTKFHQWPTLHVVYGPWEFEDLGEYHITNISSGATTKCDNIKIIDCLPGCQLRNIGDGISSLSSLRKLFLRFVPGYNMPTFTNTGVYYQHLSSLTGLQEIELHNVTKCGQIDITSNSNHSPFNSDINYLQRIDLPDYEEGFIYVRCGYLDDKKPPKDIIVNTPKLKKSKYLPVVFNYNKKEYINDTIEYLNSALFGVTSTSYNNGLETIKLTALKQLKLSSSSILGDMPDLKLAYFPVLETFTASDNTSATLFSNCDRNGLYVSMPSLNSLVTKRCLCATQNLTLDMASVTEIDLYSLIYNSNKYYYITLLTPNLETIKLENWASSSSYLYSSLKIQTNKDFNFTLTKLSATSLPTDYYGYLIADNINILTVESTANIYHICRLLIKSKFKKLVCTFTDYDNTTTKDFSTTNSSDTNITYLEPLIRDGVELDFGTGSALDKDLGKWMNDNEFAKLFTNLVTLPEGETRILVLGDNKTKLSDETIAIATNKGWIIQ